MSASALVRDGTNDWWNSSLKATTSTRATVSSSGANHPIGTDRIALHARTPRTKYSRTCPAFLQITWAMCSCSGLSEGKRNWSAGTIIREVPLLEKESVENKKITAIQASSAIQRLVFPDTDNDVFFESYERRAAAAALIDPVFLLHTLRILFTVPVIGLTKRKQDGVGIHSNAGFLGLHGFLILLRKRFDARLVDALLGEVENGAQEILDLFRRHVLGQLVLEHQGDLGSLGVRSRFLFLIPRGSAADAHLDVRKDAFLFRPATIDFKLDGLVVELDRRDGHDFSRKDGLAVFGEFFLQLVPADNTIRRQFNAGLTKGHWDPRSTFGRDKRTENRVTRVLAELGVSRQSQTQNQKRQKFRLGSHAASLPPQPSAWKFQKIGVWPLVPHFPAALQGEIQNW